MLVFVMMRVTRTVKQAVACVVAAKWKQVELALILVLSYLFFSASLDVCFIFLCWHGFERVELVEGVEQVKINHSRRF